MNSKESIQKIKDFKVVFSEGVIYPFEDYYKEEIATIERDLDKLNKITKILTDLMEDEKDGWLDEYNLGQYLCKIEEWLNDK